MKKSHYQHSAFLPQATIMLVLLFCLPEKGLGEQAKQDNNKAPLELQLILSPGKEEGNNITFSTDKSRPAVKSKRKPMVIDIADVLPLIEEHPAVAQPEIIETDVPEVVVQEAQPPVSPEDNDLDTIPVTTKEMLTTNEPHVVESIQKEESKVIYTQSEISVEEVIQEVEQEPIAPKPLYVDFKPEFSMSTGYRRDNLNFSISPSDGSPNILSELTWVDLDTFEVTSEGRWSNSSHIYVRGGFGLGWIENGDIYDSDYLSDDRQDEFSRAIADADGGTVWDATAGVGYRFDLPLSASGGKLHFIPMAGYGFNAQNFSMRRGVQLHWFDIPLGPIEDLHSTYKTIWEGPWVGFDTILGINDKHSLSATFAYHWPSYEAEADWNLRSDFAHPVSFEHSANGKGVTGSLAYRYVFSDNWFFNMEFDYRNFKTGSGDDTTYFSDGTYTIITLNEAEWESYSILFGIGFTF